MAWIVSEKIVPLFPFSTATSLSSFCKLSAHLFICSQSMLPFFPALLFQSQCCVSISIDVCRMRMGMQQRHPPSCPAALRPCQQAQKPHQRLLAQPHQTCPPPWPHRWRRLPDWRHLKSMNQRQSVLQRGVPGSQLCLTQPMGFSAWTRHSCTAAQPAQGLTRTMRMCLRPGTACYRRADMAPPPHLLSLLSRWGFLIRPPSCIVWGVSGSTGETAAKDSCEERLTHQQMHTRDAYNFSSSLACF